MSRKAALGNREFKVQAVRLATHPEIQTQDVAQALDIHPFIWGNAINSGESLRAQRPEAGVAASAGACSWDAAE
jgi:hypothetical protein